MDDNSSSDIAEGDIVRLVSGGPKMTVTAVSLAGMATVLWFDEDQSIHETTMPVKFLVSGDTFIEGD